MSSIERRSGTFTSSWCVVLIVLVSASWGWAQDPVVGACCNVVDTVNRECIGGPRDGQLCVTSADCACTPGVSGCADGTCAGDALCVEVAQAECPEPSPWRAGRTCDSTCYGGQQHGQVCRREADCPGGWCESPFLGGKLCGVSACCMYNQDCLNLTEKECLRYPPLDSPKVYSPGVLCDEGGHRCPLCAGQEGNCCAFDSPPPPVCVGGGLNGQPCNPDEPFFLSACIQAGGTCPEPHRINACCDGECMAIVAAYCFCGWEDSPCCCDADHWGPDCVRLANIYCNCPPTPPPYDECFEAAADGRASGPAFVTRALSLLGRFATASGSDPPFTCVEGYDQVQAGGTVWFWFEAPAVRDPGHETVTIVVDVCPWRIDHEPVDSVVQAFAIGAPGHGRCDDGATCSIRDQDCADHTYCRLDLGDACSSLRPIGCNDDGPADCGSSIENSGASRLRLDGLTPGDPYFVLVGSKQEPPPTAYLVLNLGPLPPAANLRTVAAFQRCFGINAGGVPPECASFDYDHDGKVELDDYRILHMVLVGP